MDYVQPLGGAAGAPYVDANPALAIEGSAVPAAAIEHPMREIMAVITGAGMAGSGADLTQLKQAIERMIDAQSGNYALDTGVANAYVVALNPAIAAYGDGMTVRVKIVNANTGASTLNAGGGAVPLVNDVGGALAAGDLPAGGIVTATYIASAASFYITAMVQSQGDARYATLAQFTGANQSLSSNGYQKLPGGLIIQWGSYPAGAATGTITFPITFPNACLTCQATDNNNVATQVASIATLTTASNFAFAAAQGASAYASVGTFNWLAVGY
ncbi:hypothetical protein SKTS_13720 [Sulfurimicrobium lacus]|uniref:Putative tail fiber protein gp53-like C-terminal domain-containing protein n=1 Tax=Sulfurimicrobium lacus TaxID=2715678 RepID=A0A6F8VBV0_9PROT|nr:hypothetical protein [Sulfurimicrobium lacus]BCB26486.1 hypothetical protein SKTS_13720 [Sulfurimicrobium lacus]